MAILGETDNDVCAQPAGLAFLASILDGADCGAYDNAVQQADRNADLEPVETFDPVTVQGVTVGYLESVPWPTTSYNSLTCFKWTGTRPSGYAISVDVSGAEGTTNSTGTSEINPYCPPDSNLSGWWVTAPLSSFKVTLWDNSPPFSDPTFTSDEVTGTWGLPDPLRQWRCTIVTTDGSYSALSATFTESDDTLALVQCPSVPDDEEVLSITVEEIVGSVVYTVIQKSVTNAYSDWVDQYGQCTNGSCLLDLRLGDSSCFLIPDFTDCAYWDEHPEDFSCWVGTIPVPLSECNVYRTAFNYGVAPPGGVYTDPLTGDEVDGTSSPSVEQQIEKSLYERLRSNKGFASAARATQQAVVSLVASACLARTNKARCLGPIYAPGIEYPDVSAHAFAAITTSLKPSLLTYVERDVKKLELPSQWYKSLTWTTDATCLGATPTNKACDEYPYFSTEQGGTGASLEYLDLLENSSEGGFRAGFYNACHFSDYPRNSEERDFVVIPLLALPSAWWCGVPTNS